MHIDGHSTKKIYYSSNNKTIYYTRTIVKLKKSSLSLPYFLYYTIHIDNVKGDLNCYASPYAGGSYLIGYGINGYHNDVSSEIYDNHQSFEILSDK